MAIHEKSYGAVIYRKEGKNIVYLLLLYERNGKQYWDFPKGHPEPGESAVDAMKREVFEEAGLRDVEVVDGFKENVTQFFRQGQELIVKDVAYFLAFTQQKEVKASYEHKDARWFMYEEALETMHYKRTKEVLTKAHRFLNSGRVSFQKTLA